MFCLFFHKKLLTKALRLFFVYVSILSVFSVFGALFLYIGNKTNYYWAVRLYTITEYSLFSLFFVHIISNGLVKKFLKISIAPFILFGLINGWISNKDFNIYPLIFEFIIFILVIIFYLFEIMNKELDLLLHKNIYFWISVGLFFYFSGNFFYMLLVEYSPGMTAEGKSQLKIIYSAVTISKNLILGLSLFASVNPLKKSNDNLLPQDLDLDTIKTNSSIN